MQASRLDKLRQKLEREGLENVTYFVVNSQEQESQKMYDHLKSKASENINVFQQEEHKSDIWKLLKGEKDDFLIYDRCGRLIYHIGLPYSLLRLPYVERAVRVAYCKTPCGNCSHTPTNISEVCGETVPKTEIESVPHHHHQQHHRHHHHHHHHPLHEDHGDHGHGQQHAADRIADDQQVNAQKQKVDQTFDLLMPNAGTHDQSKTQRELAIPPQLVESHAIPIKP